MIQPESSQVIAIFSLLFALGVGYNALIGWAGRQGYLEGYSSLAVAFGAGFTLAGVALIDKDAALLALGAFAASGAPMAAGSIWRYIWARREEQERERQTARMAERGKGSQGHGG